MIIKLKDVSLELLVENNRFLGIGAVRYGATLLRSPRLPWTFYTESDQGVRFEDYRFVKVVKTRGGGRTIVFTAHGRWLPRIQDADAMGDARVKTRRVAMPVATFRWSFRPITERLWENEWTGLAMQLEVASPGVPLHWLIEDATWEIGGVAAGATLTSGIGLRVKSPVNAGTIGILYGLKIEDQIQGGSNYALSTGAGRVSFGDTVAFVGGAALPGSISSSATAGLAIQGKAGSSVDLIIRNATGNGVMQLAPGGSTPIFPNGVNLGQTTLTQYQEGSFTPTFNNLVVVNGTGSASYTGRYTRVGNRVDWEVVIGVSGTCTVAANSSSTTITNLPFSSANSSVLVASDNAARNYGTGVVIGGATTAYVPTWAAVNNAVVITGTLLL